MTEASPRKKARLTTKNLRLYTETLATASSHTCAQKHRAAGLVGERSDSVFSVTTMDEQFAPQLTRNGVRTTFTGAQTPTDLDSVSTRLFQGRESPPPSPTQYDIYARKRNNLHNEGMTVGRLWPSIARDPSRRKQKYDEYIDIEWSDVNNPVITRNLYVARPNIYEAFSYDCYPAKTLVALPSLMPNSGCHHVFPSFACEARHHRISTDDVATQCSYDGALMVDSAWQAHQHMRGHAKDFFGLTKAVTVAFNGADVKIFLHHMQPAAEPRDPGLPDHEHHQVPVYEKTIKDHASFQKVVRVVRNAQDIGFDLAKTLKERLHEYESKA